MNTAPIIINYFGNSFFVSSEIKIAENMNITEKKERTMAEFNAETINTVNINSTVNAGTPENPLKAEAFHLLHQIFDSGNETLMNYATIQLRLLAGKDTEKETDIPTSQMLTGSESPADNLDCLKSMIDLMKASAMGISSLGGTLSQTEWDGMVYMLGIISNDLEVIADNL